ncbi:MAG: AraC family transcriptional regulator [Deltaproteobacteria bacterium]|nr:AraC family transcriptional regulator [Deltaproteobacteria bacterium]
MKSYKHTISALLFFYAVKQGGHAGLSEEELCAAVGVKQGQLQDIGANKEWLPYEAYKKLLAEVVRKTGNEFFWLRYLEFPVISLDNPAYYYYYNAPNLREATSRHEKFYFIHSRTAYPSYLEIGDEFCIRATVYGAEIELSPYHVDLMLSAWWWITHYFTGPTLKLRCVRLANVTANRKAAYEQFFKAPVITKHPFNELVFDREVLELPNFGRNIDPNLNTVLERIMQPLLADAIKDMSIRELVYEAMQRHLPKGTPKIEVIAKNLGLSTRTLQRQLKETGISFSDLVQITRSELAVQYLRNPGLNISEVAQLLGFQESSSFTSAFRKWYQTSPKEYRRQRLS